MTADLELIPKIPDGLREAALRGRLRLFIGAGASRLAGCPGWADFADGALRQLVQKGKFTYSELEQIKHLGPRVKLSIATTLADETKTPIDWSELLHPVPRANQATGQRLYNSLFALGNILVTTNYDQWLDDRIASPIAGASPLETPSTPSPATTMRSVYDADNFLPAALTQSNTVIHLHGSVVKPKSMIVTSRDYVERYANDRNRGTTNSENRALTFLEHLFGHYTVLFIGYGLEELEILEYVILKARPRANSSRTETRHYLLQGFFSHEQTLRRRLDTYYRECGIELISFLRDQRDHEQLLEVLQHFAQRIPASALLMLEEEQELEDLAREMESPT